MVILGDSSCLTHLFLPQNMGIFGAKPPCLAMRWWPGSAEVNSISMGNLSPAWIPGEAFFEEIYAFQGANSAWAMAGRWLEGLENV